MRTLTIFLTAVVLAAAGCGANENGSPGEETVLDASSPNTAAPTYDSTQTPPPAPCEVELAFTSADDDDATELAGTVTLSQQGPCDLDVNVGIALVDEHGEMLVDEKGEIVAIAGGEIQYVLTADQPTLTVLTRWTNWCGSEEVAATFDAGAFGQELHDPVTPGCQDDSDSTELSPLEFMHH